MILGAEGAGKPEFKRSSWARRLSGPGRTAAGVCAATGMLTSLIPLITMDPPVMGRRQWSVLQMVLYQRVKPNLPPVSLKVWQFDFGAVYLLMLIVFVSSCFSASRKLISATSMLGAVYAYHLWRFAQMDLDLTFYRYPLILITCLRFALGRG